MSDGLDVEFSTKVQGLRGEWPGVPDKWSFSSLTQAQACPRQWMLSRASYPDVWDRSGYPDRPHVASLAGDIVHSALETITRAFVGDGCTNVHSPEAVQILRRLGGYSAIIGAAIQECVNQLAGNPRMSSHTEKIVSDLGRRAPELKSKVQAIVSRTDLEGVSDAGVHHGHASAAPGPLQPGLYAELSLAATDLGLGGRVDLLRRLESGCEVVDYKTGSPENHHADQVRFYAVLWSRDAERNPGRELATRLVLSYSTHDVEVEAPTAAEVDQIEAAASDAISQIRVALSRRPPPAIPTETNCRYCSVRHICDDYWTTFASGIAPSPSGDQRVIFRDIEVNVVSRNGPTSWIVAPQASSASEAGDSALLRTPDDTMAFEPGTRLRLLNVTETHDDETQRRLITLTSSSEVFACG